jgi:hypothetical protein
MLTSAITELERGLPKLKKTSYSSIDKLMRTIMKKYDLTAKELHNGFVNKHDKTPDEWIKGKKLKTFKEFLEESAIARKILDRAMVLANQNKNNSEKFKTYIDLIRKTKKRLDNKEEDYPGRTSARKDKYLIPSNRTSSFPELSGISTRTKNPKKLRKQRALGEIT